METQILFEHLKTLSAQLCSELCEARLPFLILALAHVFRTGGWRLLKCQRMNMFITFLPQYHKC